MRGDPNMKMEPEPEPEVEDPDDPFHHDEKPKETE